MSQIESWKVFRRCSAGCDEGWENLVGRHESDLRGLIARAIARVGMKPRGELVGELLQELYCRLLRGRARAFAGGNDGAMWRYLERMVRSVAVDHRRRDQRRRPVDRLPDDSRVLRLHGARRATCPEERLLDRERRRLVARRCARLAGDSSSWAPRVLHLALVEGWSSREIAGLYRELTPNQVDRLISRLRRRLADRGVTLPRRPPRITQERPPRAVAGAVSRW